MKDIIKAVLLIVFSISLLIYDQQNYESIKKEQKKETKISEKNVFNPLVQDFQIRYSHQKYDSTAAKLFDHKYFQATKSGEKNIGY